MPNNAHNYNFRHLRARTSRTCSSTLERVVVLPRLLQLLALLEATLLPKRRRKRKKRVNIHSTPQPRQMLTSTTEKEESDDDMGFGLFD